MLCLALAMACDGQNSASDAQQTDTMAIREATDPVPEPPTLSDTSRTPSIRQQKDIETRELYRISGTEPFWSLTIGQPHSIYRTMEGDSVRFAYQEPRQAQGRQEEWAQLYPLGETGWVLLRRGNSPCSDGMSDKEYTYTATLWLNGRLLDGCGEKL